MARGVRVFSTGIDEPRAGSFIGIGEQFNPGGDQSEDFGGGAPPFIIACQTYVGPIVYCGFQEFMTEDGFGPTYYRSYTISGQNFSKIAGSPGCPTGDCVVGSGNILGVTRADFFGTRQYNPFDCSLTGQLRMDFSANGLLPHTSYFLPAAGFATIYNYFGTSLANLVIQVPGWVIWENTLTTPNIRTHYTEPANAWCFVLQGPGYGKGCAGSRVFESLGTTILPADLGYTTVNDSCTQTIISFDSGTNTYQGSLSQLNIKVFIPASTTSVLGTFNFEATPIGGGTTEYITITERLTGPSAQFSDFIVPFPRLIGYDTTYVSGSISLAAEIAEDFESYNLAENNGPEFYFILPQTQNWPFDTFSISPSPNAEVCSDFEDFTQASGSVLTQIAAGYYWPDTGEFLTVDPTECSDDFEAYAAGPIYTIGQGTGWASPGYTLIGNPYEAYDDFESYAVGSITFIPGLNPSPLISNFWTTSDGVFIEADYDEIYDDLDGYPDGAITLLDLGTDWSDDGIFIP